MGIRRWVVQSQCLFIPPPWDVVGLIEDFSFEFEVSFLIGRDGKECLPVDNVFHNVVE
jgi:hypothetical protein